MPTIGKPSKQVTVMRYDDWELRRPPAPPKPPEQPKPTVVKPSPQVSTPKQDTVQISDQSNKAYEQSRPQVKPEVKPAVMPPRDEIKLQPKPEVKLAMVPQRDEVKPQPKPEVKPAMVPQRDEVKPQPKPEVKLAMVPPRDEVKPKPKLELKPAIVSPKDDHVLTSSKETEIKAHSIYKQTISEKKDLDKDSQFTRLIHKQVEPRFFIPREKHLSNWEVQRSSIRSSLLGNHSMLGQLHTENMVNTYKKAQEVEKSYFAEMNKQKIAVLEPLKESKKMVMYSNDKGEESETKSQKERSFSSSKKETLKPTSQQNIQHKKEKENEPSNNKHESSAWDVTKSFFEGAGSALWQDVKDTAEGAVQLVTHPIDTSKAVWNNTVDTSKKAVKVAQDAWNDPKGTYNKAYNSAVKEYTKFKNATPEQQAHMIGEGIGKSAGYLIPIGGEIKVGATVVKDSVAVAKVATKVTEADLKKLQQLAEQAAKTVAQKGNGAFSPNQLKALEKNPNLKAAFNGTAIDQEWKKLVSQDPNLSKKFDITKQGVRSLIFCRYFISIQPFPLAELKEIKSRQRN